MKHILHTLVSITFGTTIFIYPLPIVNAIKTRNSIKTSLISIKTDDFLIPAEITNFPKLVQLEDLSKSDKQNSETSRKYRRKRRPVSKELAQKLQAKVDKTVEETGITGVTVAIVGSKGIWLGTSGFSDLKNQTPMNPRSRFNIASISKTFTATTVLSLIDEGKLNLEDKLNKWLPTEVVDNIPNGKDITIRHLLNHTSGIPDYDENPAIKSNPLLLYIRDWSQDELIALVYGIPPKHSPGQGYSYSATNYLLLAMIVESATNSTFANQVRDRIIKLLNLKDTFVPPQEPVPTDLVSGYLPVTQEQLNKLEPNIREFLDQNVDYVEDNQNRKLYDVKSLPRRSGGYGSGSIISSALDVAKFAQFLFSGKLLKPETLQQMRDFVPDPDGGYNFGDITNTGYGLGLESLHLPFPLNKAWGHNGQNPGYVTQMWYLPEYNITAVALVNERNNYLEPNPTQELQTSQLARDKILLDTLKVLLEK
ncbi:MAG: serine hydrolase domain-containing protein [Cyanobacteria bacterium P01_A01_bin.84]